MNARSLRMAVLALALAASGTASAAPPAPHDPDWPCQQIKVPTLSVAAIWTGPELPDRAAWRDDPEIAGLVARLSERRVPLAQAEAEVHAFAARAGAQKQARLLALFAGLFEAANAARDSVMAGLERFGRRQRELAASLRASAARLGAAQADPALASRLAEQVAWDSRVFEERNQTLSHACEVPARIEQRLFALARAIQQELE